MAEPILDRELDDMHTAITRRLNRPGTPDAATADAECEAFAIPGTSAVLLSTRAANGSLTRMTCHGHLYFETRGAERVFGDSLAVMSEVLIGRRLMRCVRAASQTWVETYAWDEAGYLTHVDGVDVTRDALHRVTACLGAGTTWRYTYDGDDLASIEGPHGMRNLPRGPRGRPLRCVQGSQAATFDYDTGGYRRDVPRPPATWHRDALGRLWTVSDGHGRIVTTYLWDGLACLGRIDGPPGDPLSAVFSLDPSCTPVRATSRTAVTRFPRDAYGETLLDHPGVPGLFGGAVHAGHVYLMARTVDPRTGAFTAPDPWHGLADDPRRANGYRGPLTIENQAAGPYAICQYDPIGRADPTGTISWWLLLSDFTWSLQNNLLGWFGLDAVINFWGSLFSGNIGRFFSSEGLSSTSRLGSFGVRRDGVVSYKDRAWTFQHQVWASHEHLEELQAARVFNPKGRLPLTLYGTLLRIIPNKDPAFLLRGSGVQGTDIPPRAPNWTRAGGKAEPVIPGSPMPSFPTGGLHLDSKLDKVLCPQDATLVELEPVGIAGIGPIEDRVVITIRRKGLGLTTNQDVLLSDATGAVVITKLLAAVEEGWTTRVRLDRNSPGVQTREARLQGLSTPDAVESLGTAPASNSLSTTGSSRAYKAGDALRLSQSGAPVGAALIKHLEVSLQLEAALPGDLGGKLLVRVTQPDGRPKNATLAGNVITFPAGQTLPGKGEAIALTGSGTSVATVIDKVLADRKSELDRAAADLAALGANVTWQRLTGGEELGTRDAAPQATAVVTYTAKTVRKAQQAATVGFVLIEGRAKNAARRVTGVAYDALILNSALPGDPTKVYDVQRYNVQAPDERNLTITLEQVLLLPAALPTGSVTLHLHQFSGASLAALTPLITGMNVTGATASATLTSGTTGRAPTPSQLLVLTQAGKPDEPAVVKEVRLTATFDRHVTVSAAGLEVVRLGSFGPAYEAERIDAQKVTLLPQVTVSGVKQRVQMPHFNIGELVEAAWTGAAKRGLYRAVAVEGSTLTLEGEPALPSPAPSLTVRRLVPGDPDNGGSRAGVSGIPIGGTAAGTGKTRSAQVKCRVWSTDALPGNALVAVVDGNAVQPAVVTSALDVEVEFLAVPGLTGAGITLTTPNLNATGYAASVSQEGSTVLLRDDPPPLTTPGTDRIAVVAYKESPRQARGELSAGTVLVPEAPEEIELTRRNSLIEHELRHTRQSANWGPLLLSWLPLGMLYDIMAVSGDVDLPEFSAYVPGTMASDGPARFLTIPDFRGIDFQPDDTVQVSGGGALPETATLGPRDGNRFRITLGVAVPNGPVQVRRQTPDNFWNRDLWMNLLQVLTHGGVLNTVTGTVYGGIFFGIAKLFYALSRVLGGRGDTFEATVEDEGITLRLVTAEGRNAVRGTARVLVQSGDATIVRGVAGLAGERLSLTSAVEFRGEVRVAPYSTDTPESYWDWHDYFPAAVPDPSRPAAIRIEPANGDRLELKPFDRVTVTAGTSSARTDVTAVAADGTVDLADPPPTSGAERTLRIAKVGEHDPFGGGDSYLMEELGMGWMRWLFDPYGQLFPRVPPDNGTFWDWLLRSARWVFSSRAWSAIPPGFFVWDNALRQPDAQKSRMEQDSSEESGDLYSPLTRLRRPPTVVGDVARFWYWVAFRSMTVVQQGKQDRPGVHLDPTPRIVPLVTAETGVPAPTPNRGAATPAAAQEPGLAVPDLFMLKNSGDPRDVDPATSIPFGPGAFVAAPRGWLPVSPVLERTCGLYAAFTRSGKHRLTVMDNINGAAEAREAQEAKRGLSSKPKQTIFYDINVAPVKVDVAGMQVEEKPAGQPRQIVELVQTQRALVKVDPAGDRRYTVSLTRPTTGPFLRTDGDLVLVAQTTNSSAPEPVEVSRIYRYDTTRNAYAEAALSQHGLHLGGDVHVPVRLFDVSVVSSLPVRKKLSLDVADIITVRQPGEEAYVIVPAAILRPVHVGGVAYASPVLPGIINPSPTIAVETVPAVLKSFAGDGGIFKLIFPENDPPEENAAITLRVDVGTAGNSATLEARVDLNPFFRLTSGAGSFQVARGNNLTLQCSDGVQAGAVVVTPSAGVTMTVAGADVILQVDAAAPIGKRRVLVDDKANARHKAGRTFEIT